jgi:hypothetical protein
MYQNKYLKYKNKYITLKNILNQKGGGLAVISKPPTIIEEPVTPPGIDSIPNSILYNAYQCIPWEGDLRFIDPRLDIDSILDKKKQEFPLATEEQKRSWNYTKENYNILLDEIGCFVNQPKRETYPYSVVYNAYNCVPWGNELRFVDPRLPRNEFNLMLTKKFEALNLPKATEEQKRAWNITEKEYNDLRLKICF